MPYMGFWLTLWLGFMLASLAADAAEELLRVIRKNSRRSGQFIPAILSVISGVSIGIFFGNIFTLDDSEPVFFLGRQTPPIMMVDFAFALAVSGAGFALSFYGGFFGIRGAEFLAKKCFSRKFRQENKMTGQQRAMAFCSAAGVLLMSVFYLVFVKFEASVLSFLLWLYIPVFGVCLGLAFSLFILAAMWFKAEKLKDAEELEKFSSWN
ncbi:MAG: hypothetical protein LBK52_07185 [Deltaproteobacteria bacterium]|jgi:hypothetical protein|nr:hypothetical protein [Deltaproteobacteria bacterium]